MEPTTEPTGPPVGDKRLAAKAERVLGKPVEFAATVSRVNPSWGRQRSAEDTMELALVVTRDRVRVFHAYFLLSLFKREKLSWQCRDIRSIQRKKSTRWKAEVFKVTLADGEHIEFRGLGRQAVELMASKANVLVEIVERF